jgi:uncharacterized protein (DUF2141 family)
VTLAPIKVKDGGNILVALYTNEDSWLEMEQALMIDTIPVNQDTLSSRFIDLDPGEYAISVIHDKNENGKFDMRWFPWPKPKEGVGVSNNELGSRKPRYEDAVFTATPGHHELTIEMRY